MERARLLARRLGRLIHASRHEWGLTQAQMAARCGMSAKHYGQLERGDVEVTLSALERLARGFDCDPVELLVQVAKPHNRSARPTLDLRTWQQIGEVMRLVTDYSAQMLAHADTVRGFGRFVHRRSEDDDERKQPTRNCDHVTD